MGNLLIFFKPKRIYFFTTKFSIFPRKIFFARTKSIDFLSPSFFLYPLRSFSSTSYGYRGSCSAADQFRLNALRMVRTYTRLPWRCPLEPAVPRLLFSVYVPTVYRMYTWGPFATNSRRERPFAYSRPRVSPWLAERRFVITFRGPFMIHFNG